MMSALANILAQFESFEKLWTNILVNGFNHESLTYQEQSQQVQQQQPQQNHWMILQGPEMAILG